MNIQQLQDYVKELEARIKSLEEKIVAKVEEQIGGKQVDAEKDAK